MVWLLGGYMWLYVHRPFEIWTALGSLQIERMYMLLMLLVWIICPGKRLAFQRIDFAVALFAAIFFLSHLASPYAYLPDTQALAENFVKVLVFLIILITSVRDERELRILLMLFLAAVGLYMLHSFWEYMCGRYQYRMGIRRMMGVDQTYSDPNAFASTLVHTLPFLIPFWRDPSRWIPRWILFSYASLAIICILLTGSRTGFIALCLLAIILTLLLSRNKATAGLVVLTVVLLFTVCCYTLLPLDLQSRYLTIIDADAGPVNAQTSAEGRTFGLFKGLELWQANPLLGLGPGSFPHASKSGMQPHNLYGQLLSEMGTLGAISLLLLIACFLLNSFYVRRYIAFVTFRNDIFLAQFALALILSVALLLLLGFGGHNLYRYNWIWLAAFSSISIHCLRVRMHAATNQHWCTNVYPDSFSYPSLPLDRSLHSPIRRVYPG